jgi:hypothetical protein
MKKSLLLCLCAITAIGLTAQSYKPGIKLKKGQQFEITTTVKGSLQQAGMEMPIESTMLSLLNVRSEATKGYNVIAQNKHFVFRTNMMGQEANYDSDKKEDADGQMGEVFKGVTAKPDTFMVDDNGYTRSASPEKPAIKKDGQKKDMMGMMLGSVVGTSGGASPIFNLLPAVMELKVGESVTDSAENDANGKEKVITTYTLTEIKDGKIKIAINGVTNVEQTMELQQMGMNMSIVLKSVNTSKGEMIIDQATGILNSKTVTTETDGSASVSGMDIPITGSSTAVITVKAL